MTTRRPKTTQRTTPKRSRRSAAYHCSAVKVRRLVALLREADNLLVGHHDSRLCTWHGECPVCTKQGTERWPHTIFARIERELKSFPHNIDSANRARKQEG